MTERPEIDNQLRLDLLREALPYIQRFQGQTFVVKLSGKVTENPENLASLAEELALLHQVGIRICVVHAQERRSRNRRRRHQRQRSGLPHDHEAKRCKTTRHFVR